jgi:hypothetical protein
VRAIDIIKELSCSFSQKSKDLRSTFHRASRHLSADEPFVRPSLMFIVPDRPGGRISWGLGVAMFENQPQRPTISKGRMVFDTRKQAR